MKAESLAEKRRRRLAVVAAHRAAAKARYPDRFTPDHIESLGILAKQALGSSGAAPCSAAQTLLLTASERTELQELQTKIDFQQKQYLKPSTRDLVQALRDSCPLPSLPGLISEEDSQEPEEGDSMLELLAQTNVLQLKSAFIDIDETGNMENDNNFQNMYSNIFSESMKTLQHEDDDLEEIDLGASVTVGGRLSSVRCSNIIMNGVEKEEDEERPRPGLLVDNFCLGEDDEDSDSGDEKLYP